MQGEARRNIKLLAKGHQSLLQGEEVSAKMDVNQIYSSFTLLAGDLKREERKKRASPLANSSRC